MLFHVIVLAWDATEKSLKVCKLKNLWLAVFESTAVFT